ncbi:TPA: hypothetical protein EYP44_03000 [Candidatus Bathyarchaeota archaeon]|nr:hypothetical protein [Candidatus Bathyarchaeota archaeon]
MTSEERRLQSELKGKTLLTYWYLLRRGRSSVGVREVQRSLGFSSPSVAAYHLDKLRGLGLVREERGRYLLAREVKVGVLRYFVSLGRMLLPRYLFYAVLTTSMLITYVVEFYPVLDVIVLVFGIVTSAIFWYETIRVWRERPF